MDFGRGIADEKRAAVYGGDARQGVARLQQGFRLPRPSITKSKEIKVHAKSFQ